MKVYTYYGKVYTIKSKQESAFIRKDKFPLFRCAVFSAIAICLVLAAVAYG